MSVYSSTLVSQLVLLVCSLQSSNGNFNPSHEPSGLLDVYYDDQTIVCADQFCAASERCVYDGIDAKCVAVSAPETSRSNTNRLSRAPRSQSTSVRSGLARTQRLTVNRVRNSLIARHRRHCEQPGDRGRCSVPRQPTERYYYSQQQGKCVMFAYSGCGGNTNNFKTEKDCHQECILTKSNKVAPRPSSSSNSFSSGSFNRGILGDISNGNLGGSLLLAPFSGFTQGRGGFASSNAMAGNPVRQCFLKLELGTCQGIRSRRWYFDTRTSRCEQFVFTGCGGNANNYASLEECRSTCGAIPQSPSSVSSLLRQSRPSSWLPGGVIEPPSFCLLEKEQGPCTGEQLRYYYNKISKRCERFVYGGCSGNNNRFSSEQECRQFCVVEGSIEILPSRPVQSSGAATRPKLPRIPPPAKVSPKTLPDHCNLPSKAGRCFARLPRYYFNNVTKRCETFLYGGCGGNGNKFESRDACERSCNFHESLVRINVKLPTQPPQSQTKILKNSALKATNSKIVDVGETTVEPLVETTALPPSIFELPSSPPNLCYLPAQTGCNSKFTRFFYNSQSGKCESFEYGGCRPNENNFMSLKDCQQMCMADASEFIFRDERTSNSQPSSGNPPQSYNLNIESLLAPFMV